MDTSKDEDTDEQDENSDEGCRMSTNYDADEMFDCPLSQLFYVAMNLKNLLGLGSLGHCVFSSNSV